MSAVAIIMNLLLSSLLLAALAFGWRLERRLKALKDSHESFARAVADLDTAAARAEQGLADLRAATDEAAETLSDRIEAAKTLSARLERGLSAADRPRDAGAAAPRAEEKGDILIGGAAPRERSVEAFVRSEPVATPRSRARVDDDLFEPDADAGRLRAISGGRR
jgi:ABC-type transporter Mla subunit MlaD